MKNKMFKRWMAILTGTVMAVSVLGGCGGTKMSDSEQTADTAVKTDETETADESSETSETKSVSEITFPLEEPLELTVFVNASNTGGGTCQDNYVTDWIKERTNIQLNFLYDLDGDDATTKLNLIMTNPDDIPDILLATGWTKAEVLSYGEQGLIIPLDDYLVDAPNWNAMNELAPQREKDLTMADGHIYTYGYADESYASVYQNKMWIYKPWVDLLMDGKMPETTEELYEFLLAVKTQDPNGNGKADEIPLSGYIGGWSTDPTVWLINSFLQCNNPLANTNPIAGSGLAVIDGKIEFQVMKEEYKEALKYINKLYKEGLLDPQVFTQDDTQFKASLDNEEPLVAMHAGGMIQADMTTYFSKQEGRWQDWVILEPVAGPEGVRYSITHPLNYFGTARGIISANCEYPEIAVALFDFLASDEGTNVQSYGPEGVTWHWISEGPSLDGKSEAKFEEIALPEDFDWIGNGFAREYKSGSYTWASDIRIDSRTFEWRGSIGVGNQGDYSLEYLLYKASMEQAPYAYDEDSIVPNLPFASEDAKKISEYTLSLIDYVNQSTVQFITGELDIDQNWDKYISQLESMGVTDFLEIYQRNYDAYIK